MEDAPIYRVGSGSAMNLTPREKDTSGLSYNLNEPEGEAYSQTTLTAISESGQLKVVVDNPNTGHVSVSALDAKAISCECGQ
jgi:hypothetical protein